MATSGIKHRPLTLDRLRELLAYDPVVGEFRWNVRRGGSATTGALAGTVDSGGYLQIKVDGRFYLAHRLAWFYVHGEWPSLIVDHRDTDITNNRIDNLRLATDCESLRNQGIRRNNKSGFKGVCWRKDIGKWKATIRSGGNPIHLGFFDDPAKAHAAYYKAAVILHGAFARAA